MIEPTWQTIETTLTDRYQATRRQRQGNYRTWWVPHPAGGNLTIEITLRPRWCSLGIDRWHTSDRDPDIARPWLEANVWPAIREACLRHKGGGILPGGGHTWSGGRPIERTQLLDVLLPWIDVELTWAQDPLLRDIR